MVTVYSVFSSILFYNLGLIILFVLRKKKDFISKYAISTLLFLSVLSMLRLFLPLDFDAAYVVRSENILPSIIRALDYKPDFSPLSVEAALLILWCIGIVLRLAKFLRIEYCTYKMRRRYPLIRREELAKLAAELKMNCRIKMSPLVSQPYTTGIIRPTVYLPFMKYKDRELYYILLHERQHIRSQDNLKRLVFIIVDAIFWWNPLARIAVDEFSKLTEMQCDARVAKTMDEREYIYYIQTILSMTKKLNPDEDEAKPKLAVMFAQTYDYQQRLEVMLARKARKPRYIRYGVCAVMLALFIVSYLVIFQPYYPMEESFLGPTIKLDSVSYQILVSEESYYLVYNGQIVEVLSKEDVLGPPYCGLNIIEE